MDSPAQSALERARPILQQAVDLHQQGRIGEAEELYASVLVEDPTHPDACNLLGVLRYQQQRSLEALSLIAKALERNPSSADVLSNYGIVLHALDRHAEALDFFDQALALRRDHVIALNNRGLALEALGRYAEALASWKAALTIDPDHFDSLRNCGHALHRLKCHAEAIVLYERVLALNPTNVDVLNNRGGSLAALGRHGEAIAHFDRALAIDSGLAQVRINKGNALVELHEFDAAMACYAEAATSGCVRAEAEWMQSLVRLRRGEYRDGWRGYEWRWKQAAWVDRPASFAEPLWRGDVSIAGKTILLYAEQGMGDTLQFVRYVPMLAALGAHVVLEVPPPLRRLLSDVDGVTRVVAPGEPLPAFDLQCPLMSLPFAFGTELATVPAEIPYLRTPADRLTAWERRLGERRMPRVAIAWAGSRAHRNNHNRSIALDRFARLLSVPGVAFVSLQKDIGDAETEILKAHPGVIHLAEEIGDFSDTAALVAQLDLVLSVDTSVAHLAGALGRPVWVLLPFCPDFRWLLGREDSPWYPTARLFRQPRTGDWDSVLEAVRSELVALGARGG